MAKKKNRKKRRNRRYAISSRNDRHHLLFIKKKWAGGYLGKLRDFHYCIVEIPRDSLHRYIHSKVGFVPVPKGFNAKDVWLHLQDLDKRGVLHDNDPIIKRLNLLIALFDCVEQPTADALRAQLHAVYEFYEKLS